MRHQIRGRALSRTSAHKKALCRNILSALFTHERIVTTVAKAKEFRRDAERMITMAKKGDLHHRRLALAEIPDRAVISKLFSELAPRYASRKGGYTRILKLGRHRLGDNAPRAIFELVDRKEKSNDAPAVEGEEKKVKKEKVEKVVKAEKAETPKKKKAEKAAK